LIHYLPTDTDIGVYIPSRIVYTMSVRRTENGGKKLIQVDSKDRVYDIGAPDVYGTILHRGDEVSTVRWDRNTPWGAECHVSNSHLRPVDGDHEETNEVSYSKEGEDDMAKKEKAVTKAATPRKQSQAVGGGTMIRDRAKPAGKVLDIKTMRDGTKQAEVLRLMDEGTHYNTIAKKVGTSVREVNQHIENLHKKNGVGHEIVEGVVRAVYPSNRDLEHFFQPDDKEPTNHQTA
jgi:hypothetical protein